MTPDDKIKTQIGQASEAMKNFGKALSQLLAEIAKDKTPEEMYEAMKD